MTEKLESMPMSKWDVVLRILEKQGFVTLFGIAVLFFGYSFGQSYLADAEQNRTHSRLLVETQVEAVKLQATSLAQLAANLSRLDDHLTKTTGVLQSIQSQMDSAHSIMAPISKLREQELALLKEIREHLQKQNN